LRKEEMLQDGPRRRMIYQKLFDGNFDITLPCQSMEIEEGAGRGELIPE
jgi:hypothetical protein